MSRSGRWWRRAAAIGSLFLAFSLIQIVAPPAAVAAACGINSNYHVGYSHNGASPIQLEGVSAYIRDRGGYTLCTTDSNGGTNFSNSWTMVVSANFSGWAQSGTMYRWGYGSCVKRWAEQASSASNWFDCYLGGCSTVGDVRRYKQELGFWNGLWRVRSYMDSTLIRESNFDVISAWAEPYGVQFVAETTYTASNVAGNPSSKQGYEIMQVQKWSDNTWVSTCGFTSLFGGTESSRYNFDRPACNNVRTWTN